MITPLDTNPFAPAPVHSSSGIWVSGGGADGQVGEIVAWLLRTASPTVGPVALTAPSAGGRSLDLAETIAWAAASCGAQMALPRTTEQLRAACYRRRTVLPVARARAVKGALLFGGGLVGVAIGSRDRCLVHVATPDPEVVPGVVVVASSDWTWTDAGLIPGVRGYLS